MRVLFLLLLLIAPVHGLISFDWVYDLDEGGNAVVNTLISYEIKEVGYFYPKGVMEIFVNPNSKNFSVTQDGRHVSHSLLYSRSLDTKKVQFTNNVVNYGSPSVINISYVETFNPVMVLPEVYFKSSYIVGSDGDVSVRINHPFKWVYNSSSVEPSKVYSIGTSPFVLFNKSSLSGASLEVYFSDETTKEFFVNISGEGYVIQTPQRYHTVFEDLRSDFNQMIKFIEEDLGLSVEQDLFIKVSPVDDEDFFSKGVIGIYLGGSLVKVKSKLLMDEEELLGTLIHEVLHAYIRIPGDTAFLNEGIVTYYEDLVMEEFDKSSEDRKKHYNNLLDGFNFSLSKIVEWDYDWDPGDLGYAVSNKVINDLLGVNNKEFIGNFLQVILEEDLVFIGGKKVVNGIMVFSFNQALGKDVSNYFSDNGFDYIELVKKQEEVFEELVVNDVVVVNDSFDDYEIIEEYIAPREPTFFDKLISFFSFLLSKIVLHN